jgi:uncharacterized membrane protein
MAWRSKLASRKFWMSAVSAVLLLLNDGLGLAIPEDTVRPFVALILGYVLSEGIVDAARARNGHEAK